MKRDMEVVRKIILAVAASDLGKPVTRVDGIDPSSLAAHAQLLIEAGLVEGYAYSPDDVIKNRLRSGFQPPIKTRLVRLTWSGQEFADAIADDSIWQKAKEHVLKPAGSFTFSILTEYVKQEIKSRLGI